MKKSFLYLFLLINPFLFSQDLKTLNPEHHSSENKYSKEDSKLWLKAIKQCEIDYQSLSKEEKAMIDRLEMLEGPYTQGPGCSWYCGGGPYKITSTGELYSKDSLYKTINIHDFNLLTAWVPNTKKGTIGAKINFYFESQSPRINTIIIYNGYIKNYELWQKNSRVKKLKVYYNSKPVAIFKLDDTTAGQVFKIDPVRSNEKDKDLVITFEVLEVYKGTKYEDVAISEINFDGLDVHCFAAGTKIAIENGKKNIENIMAGDIVLSYDTNSQIIKKVKVTSLVKAHHNNLIHLCLTDNEITTTSDHPFWVKDKGWCSLNPIKSNTDYVQEIAVKQLAVGDFIFMPLTNTYSEVKAIKPLTEPQMTYSIELEKGNSFIANNMLVKTEQVRADN